MTKKTWIIFAVICAAIIAGMIYLANSNKVDVSHIDITKIQAATKQNGGIADHAFGKMNSKVILIEYGDYQCPGCGSAYPVIKQITEKYQDMLGFIFRNFPLYSIHPNAYAAATVAEAAGEQGKFWEMHDHLYETQSDWNQLNGADRTNYFVTAANSLGLDGNKLQNMLDDSNIKQKIDFDHALGAKAGVSGTPSFYLNGKDVANLYYKDSALVDKSVSGAAVVWSNADAFDNLVIKPTLEANGIATN